VKKFLSVLEPMLIIILIFMVGRWPSRSSADCHDAGREIERTELENHSETRAFNHGLLLDRNDRRSWPSSPSSPAIITPNLARPHQPPEREKGKNRC